MVFSSLLFVYLFLPINLLCYAVISDVRKKNLCILIFSLIFYAWMSPSYLILLIIMATVNYLGACGIERYRGTRKSTLVLVVDLIITLGFLGYFKYIGFFCEMINSLAAMAGVELITRVPEVLLPVGISFYSFQLISYVIDVYTGNVKADRNFGNVLLYTALFHQCIAGPIVRYKDIANDLKERKTGINQMNEGISRFCTGLAKKALLANSCGAVLKIVLPESASQGASLTVLGAWLGCLLYMLQIYLDFSAYSDMAIGLGKMTGFRYNENFNYPYAATSVTDFWRRWHISLSTFFRDYLYIPMGGNRRGLPRQIFNMFVVWALTGLWHGASYNFVLWGLYFFLLLVLEKVFLLKLFNMMNAVVRAVVGRVYTLIAVFFSWILFRFTDFNMVISTIRALFALDGNAFTSVELNTVLMNNIFLILVCMIACTPLVKRISDWWLERSVSVGGFYLKSYNCMNVILPIILLAIATLSLIGDSYNPFIYYRF